MIISVFKRTQTCKQYNVYLIQCPTEPSLGQLAFHVNMKHKRKVDHIPVTEHSTRTYEANSGGGTYMFLKWYSSVTASVGQVT